MDDATLQDPAVATLMSQVAPDYELARELILARQAKGLTQADVAARTGLKQAYIARLESGACNPTVESLSRVAAVLGRQVKLV